MADTWLKSNLILTKRGYSDIVWKNAGKFGLSKLPPLELVSPHTQIFLKIEIFDNDDNIYCLNVIYKSNKPDIYLVFVVMDDFLQDINHGQMGAIRPVRITPKLFFLELLIITKSKVAFKFFR